MTKKDYIIIAEAIKSAKVSLSYASVCMPETNRTIEHIVNNLAFTLAIENPLFDKVRFSKACGVETK